MARATRTRVGLVAVTLLLVAAPARAEDETHVVRSAHYELHFEGPEAEAEEASRVLEAAYVAFETFFGAAPKLKKDERLTVRFLATQAGFQAAIRADGTQPPGAAGGYYWPGSRTVYLYRQPTRYYTRVLLVHEAAHQFHFLARTKNKSPAAKWYTEGIAEHLSWHLWDGETIRLPVVPDISLKDYPKVALDEMSASDFDLVAVLEGGKPVSRPVGWALTTWMAQGDDGKPFAGFAKVRKSADRGSPPHKAFRSAFGKASGLEARIVSWLTSHQQPWEHVFNAWEMIAPGRMRGHAGVVSVCRVKAPRDRLAATLEVPAEGHWKGGLLLHFTSPDDYTVALLAPSGRIAVNRRANGAWQSVASVSAVAPRPGSNLRLEACRVEGGVTFTVGDQTFGPFDLPGQHLGLTLDNCTLTWRDIEH